MSILENGWSSLLEVKVMISKEERLKKRAKRLELLRKLDNAKKESEYRHVEEGLTALCGGIKKCDGKQVRVYESKQTIVGETEKLVLNKKKKQSERLREIAPEKIYAIYQSEGTWKLVSKQLDVSESALARYREENEEFFMSKREKRKTWRQLDRKDYIVDLIYSMRVKQSASIRKIAERVGTSIYNINQIIKNGENYARISGKKR